MRLLDATVTTSVCQLLSRIIGPLPPPSLKPPTEERKYRCNQSCTETWEYHFYCVFFIKLRFSCDLQMSWHIELSPTAVVVAGVRRHEGNTFLTSLLYFLKSAAISSVQSMVMLTSGLRHTEVTFTLPLKRRWKTIKLMSITRKPGKPSKHN